MFCLLPGAPRRLACFLLLVLSAATVARAQNLSVSPAALSFGNTAVNTSFSKLVTLMNNGSSDITLNGASISGSTAFSIVSGGSCGTKLVAGHGCTYRIAFSPTELAAYSGTLVITDSDGTSPQQVGLSGAGANPVALTITNPDFGNQVITGTTASKTATLANTQNAVLNSVVRSTTGDFAVAGGTCGTSVPARSQCTIMVSFTPTAIGTRSGSLVVTDNASNSPQSIALTGNGTTAGISSISLTPTAPVVAKGNTQQFTATGIRSNGNLNLTNVVAWSSTNGGAATISAAGLASGVNAGASTIKATLTASLTSSTVLTVTGPNAPCNGPCVLSYHNDLSRDGVFSGETILNPTNVAKTKFGRVGMITGLNGQIYAQPLFLSGLYSMSSRGNVLYIATEGNSVYAFDADTYAPLWSNVYMPAGERTLVTGSGGDMSCRNITPQVGITSTPVIDPHPNSNANPVIYFVARSADASQHYHQRLHAVDAVTGTEIFGSPVDITTPAGAPEPFDELLENQRSGLALTYDASGNPQIYISWASHCDAPGFRGWLMKYTVSSGSLSTAPTGYFLTSQGVGVESGIWMAGGAPAIDNPVNGNLFVATSNGSFDGVTNWGESVLKLDRNLNLLDYYTPNNWPCLNEIPGNPNCNDDRDLGSGGVVLFNVPNGVPEVMSAGKQGEIFALYQQNLGLWNANPDKDDPAVPNQNYAPPDNCTVGAVGSGIAQCFYGILAIHQRGTGSFSTPAFWNNTLYTAGSNDGLRAYTLSTTNVGTFDTTGAVGTVPAAFPYPGASLVVSWDGVNPSSGVLWALSTAGSFNNPPTADLLRAYSAVPSGTSVNMIYQGNVGPGAVRLVMPIVANGKVIVAGQGFSGTGTEGQVYIYGLCPCN